MLEPWWSIGSWPKLDGLSQHSCADLLFTAGKLTGFVGSTVQLQRGQQHAEELLNGSVALFEQLRLKPRAGEARIELALCYQRQGLFDMAGSTLIRVLDDLGDENGELLTLAFMRLASVERQAGRLKDALTRLMQITETAQLYGPWITGRVHLELASAYKDLAVSDDIASYFVDAKRLYLQALYEFKAVGQHRYVSVVENNIGLLLLSEGSYQESENHLLRARRLFDAYSDTLRGAQANETLARLYINTKRYTLAREVIEQAVETLEVSDSEGFLAEALTTAGVVAARQTRYGDAKKNFEAAYKVAERCRDNEGAGRALLIMFEEMRERLEDFERTQLLEKLKTLFASTQQTDLLARLKKCIAEISNPVRDS
jgi:tetratricopeptide (TPR) repeat protein